MGKVFIISDLHFSHKNITKFIKHKIERYKTTFKLSLNPRFCQTAVRRFGFLFIKIIAVLYNTILFLFFPNLVENWLIQVFGFLFGLSFIGYLIEFYKQILITKIENNESK